TPIERGASSSVGSPYADERHIDGVVGQQFILARPFTIGHEHVPCLDPNVTCWRLNHPRQRFPTIRFSRHGGRQGSFNESRYGGRGGAVPRDRTRRAAGRCSVARERAPPSSARRFGATVKRDGIPTTAKQASNATVASMFPGLK